MVCENPASYYPVTSNTSLEVSFSEAVTDAEGAVNYAVNPSLAVLAVTDLGDDRYKLTTAAQTDGASYTLTTSNIVDQVSLSPDPVSFTGAGATGGGDTHSTIRGGGCFYGP